MQFTADIGLNYEWYISEDGKYKIVKEPSPWEPDNAERWSWLVYVNKYAKYPSAIKSTATLIDAQQFVEADAAADTWDTHGDCRWCGMAKADLMLAPRWWFGCNLCETELQNHEPTPETDASDHEYEPLHD